jgi:uncharacterized membrane protein YhaH (DUF805 family)
MLVLIPVIAYVGDSNALWIVAGITIVVLAVAETLVSAQRCRDFGWTGWAILISCIPVVGWIFGVAITFVPGNIGPNRYGPDPIPRH